MTQIDWAKLDIRQAAAAVYSHLAKNGLDAVLVGGACVSIYSRNRYQSLDLDFIPNASEKQIKNALAEIGFVQAGGRHFDHPQCRYFVEFISPPVAVGAEIIRKFNVIDTPAGRLKLLTPTDCLKDRLAAYVHWKDRQSFEQAKLVAKGNRINWKSVAKWAAGEHATAELAEFRAALRRSKT